MLFEVEQGDDLDDLKAAEHLEGPQGDMAREILSECPDLTPYEESFYRSFRELGTMRQVGMSPGAIPWDKIVQYGQYHGFTRTDTDILIRVIQNMDASWQNAIRERNAPTK